MCCELIQETRAFLKNARLAWRLTNQQMGRDGMGVSPEAIMESCTFFRLFLGCLPQFLLPNLYNQISSVSKNLQILAVSSSGADALIALLGGNGLGLGI